MCKFFAKSIVLMAIMTVSLSTSFGQTNTNLALPEVVFHVTKPNCTSCDFGYIWVNIRWYNASSAIVKEITTDPMYGYVDNNTPNWDRWFLYDNSIGATRVEYCLYFGNLEGDLILSKAGGAANLANNGATIVVTSWNGAMSCYSAVPGGGKLDN